MDEQSAQQRAERLVAEWYAKQSSDPDCLGRLIAAELLAVQREADKYRLALESLTPGGSEFVRDEARCVEYVRDIKHRYVEAMKENVRLRKAIRGESHE